MFRIVITEKWEIRIALLLPWHSAWRQWLYASLLKFTYICLHVWASHMVLVVKKLPANAGDAGDMNSIAGWERCPGGGNGKPLQYSFLENPLDRGGCQATFHGVSKSRTWLSDLACMHAFIYLFDNGTVLRIYIILLL